MAVGLLTDLDFNFNGTPYTEATANTGYLSFDANGRLDGVLFGTACSAGSCTFPANGDWAILASIANGAFTGEITDRVGFGDFRHGTVTVAQVPEPTTLALLGLGLAGVGVMRRQKPAA